MMLRKFQFPQKLFCFGLVFLGSSAQALNVPESEYSTDGLLDIVLTIERTVLVTVSGFTLHTRTLNGSIPGPTLHVRAGDRI